MVLIAICYHGRKGNGGRGKAPGDFSKLRLFHLRGAPFLIRKGYYKKDTFSFAEKGSRSSVAPY